MTAMDSLDEEGKKRQMNQKQSFPPRGAAGKRSCCKRARTATGSRKAARRRQKPEAGMAAMTAAFIWMLPATMN